MNPYDNGDDQFDFILNSMCFWMIQSISGQWCFAFQRGVDEITYIRRST
jgi:hypothetical protein